jgi:hypothetical protein
MPAAFAGFYPEAMRVLLPAVIAMNVVISALAVQQWRQQRLGAGLVLPAVAISFGGPAAFVLVLGRTRATRSPRPAGDLARQHPRAASAGARS